jgi:leucyl/phenylalanyl-tRNA--protein transferase
VGFEDDGMTVFLLSEDSLGFPDPELAETDGLLAVGGDLSVERLKTAYGRGIFPWYGPGTPILWWSPDPRLVLPPKALHIPRSLRRVINRRTFEISIDTAFHEVVTACAFASRSEGHGTWLVPDMIEAYGHLHGAGFAHSFEARLDGELVGGLYGVALGRMFFGESMFFNAPDASKTAFVWAARLLDHWGYELIDCQQTTAHLQRFGAFEIPRQKFLRKLHKAVGQGESEEAWVMPEGFFPL